MPTNLFRSTSRFNETFKRNRDRFPEDFAFQRNEAEVKNLRSQFAISSQTEKPGRSRLRPAPGFHGGPRYLPWAVTEHGALMAANILRSRRAVQMGLYVVRSFMLLRRQVLESEVMSKRLAVVEKELREHNQALLDIYYKIEPLLRPPPEAPAKRRIGFQRRET